MQFVVPLFFTVLFCIIIAIFERSEARKPTADELIRIRANMLMMPWIGVLQIRTNSSKSAVTGIIMVSKGYAIGNAHDIEGLDKKTLRKNARGIFYNTRLSLKKFNLRRTPQAWTCIILNYFTHPEFSNKTINTLTVLKLKPNYTVPSYFWEPIALPKLPQRVFNETFDSVYSFGYSEHKGILEQDVLAMETVTEEDCRLFYVKEMINFKIIWPAHYHCLIEKHQNENCLYEPGRAIASNSTGNWTLLGMSIYGPGCVLPSRYIDIIPYKRWIEKVIATDKIPLPATTTDWRKYWPGRTAPPTPRPIVTIAKAGIEEHVREMKKLFRGDREPNSLTYRVIKTIGKAAVAFVRNLRG